MLEVRRDPGDINWRYVATELGYVIDDAEIVLMVAEDEYLPLLDELRFTNVLRLRRGTARRHSRSRRSRITAGR